MNKGLEQTRDLFEPVEALFAGVYAVAHALGNAEEKPSGQVRLEWEAGLKLVAEGGQKHASLKAAAEHLERVSRSYEPGLFQCYQTEGLPRTNNDLEQLFGRVRYHERRASGRKVGSASLVTRGATRVTAAVVTRMEPASVADIVPTDKTRLAELRAEVERRREQRRQHHRFRRHPDKFLKDLENKLPQSGLSS